LRHDIDFDVSYAYDIAKIEQQLGLKSIYFFMLKSNSYNLLSNENIKLINKICMLGHQISIHFDPKIYSDYIAGFKVEKDIFEKIFNIEIKIISIHRPNKFFLTNNASINGIEHTYMKKYFHDTKYISDSGGSFKYDHPIQNCHVKNGNNIHLLLHPIWWCNEGNTPIEKINSFMAMIL